MKGATKAEEEPEGSAGESTGQSFPPQRTPAGRGTAADEHIYQKCVHTQRKAY